MTKTLQLILILSLLTTFIICQANNNPNNVANTYKNVKSYFNTQQFDKIYALFATTGSDKTSQLAYTSDLSTLYTTNGPILYDYSFGVTNTFESNQINAQVVAFNNSLIMGQVVWIISKGVVIDIAFASPDKNSSLDLFNNNTGQASLSIFFNGLDTLQVNKTQLFNINSLITIPIALEFARQVNTKSIDPTTMVLKDDIKKFFIPGFDVGFPVFVMEADQKGLMINKKVSLQTIASGMMNYVSPALTEYLQTLLGLSNIDSMSANVGLEQNKSFYAASFAMAFTNWNGQKRFYWNIKNMTSDSLNQTQLQIHNTLLTGNFISENMIQDANFYLKKKFIRQEIQKWQQKGTTLQYATLFNNLNNTNLLKQTVINQFNLILNPVYNQKPVDQSIFVQDNSIAVYSKGTINLVGSAQLQVAIGGVSEINYALFVEGLTRIQTDLYSNQVGLLTQFITSNPTFCKDYLSRIQQ